LSITSQTEPIAKIKSKQIMKLLNTGKRLDERGLDEYRKLTVDVGLVKKAEGSAMVSLGNTKVLAGIKVETGAPYSDTPNQGVITVNSELLPLAHEIFEPGPPDENSIELARVVDRGIRGSKTVDLEKLVLVPGKLVYVVFVDIYVLNHDGNLIDASEYAAIVALANTKLPVFEINSEGEAKATGEYKFLRIKDCPISVTFAKVGNALVVDPLLDEELIASTKITITVNKDGNVCAIQKSGTGILTMDEILKAQRMAKEKAAEIRSMIPRWR
jgi:exosome complex component RRP42